MPASSETLKANRTLQCCYSLSKKKSEIISNFQQLFMKALASYILKLKTIFVIPDEYGY